ncbi:glycerophosphodiester phosphodiesterase [Terrabacter sp. BE26]|uniref:glycerophosphodiester phosphodiesterase n=1 Tax=Terrabacter sp. BE26 TaxID=2898152 RepID=UPI0035BE944F
MTIDPRAGGGRALAVAHRGDPVTHRENTLQAVGRAIDAGADLVEIDVKTTADGVSVVLHDDNLARLWEVERDIRELTVHEVDAVGALPSGGSMRIPRLQQVLQAVAGTGVGLLIDMDSGEWASAALSTVTRAASAGEVRPTQVVWCGHIDALRAVRRADPNARIFLSWGEQLRDGLPSDELVAELRPEAFNPHWEAVGGPVRDWASDHGLALCCWTVDDPNTIATVLHEGADAVISNQVDLVVQEVARWNQTLAR